MNKITTIQINTDTLKLLRVAKARLDMAKYENLILYLLKKEKDAK